MFMSTAHHLAPTGSALCVPLEKGSNSPFYFPLLSLTLRPAHLLHLDHASWRPTSFFFFANYNLTLYLGKTALPTCSRHFYRLDDIFPEDYHLPFMEVVWGSWGSPKGPIGRQSTVSSWVLRQGWQAWKGWDCLQRTLGAEVQSMNKGFLCADWSFWKKLAPQQSWSDYTEKSGLERLRSVFVYIGLILVYILTFG